MPRGLGEALGAAKGPVDRCRSRATPRAGTGAWRIQMHAGSARAHAIFNDPMGAGLCTKNRILRLPYWRDFDILTWTFWELPNLLPCGRLRRRTFKCFEHLCVFKDFINTTPTPTTWSKTHALHLDRNSQLDQLHLVSSTELK